MSQEALYSVDGSSANLGVSKKRSKVLSSKRFTRQKTKKFVFQDPELDDVLENKLPEPFTRENFYIFLKKQAAEESLEFYENVQELKVYLEQKRNPNSSLKIKDLDQKIEMQLNKIVENYVKSDAEFPINISGTTRNNTLESVATSESAVEIDISIFDQAIGEIRRLLNGDPFFLFVKKAKTENLTEKTAEIRSYYGIFFIAFGLGVAGSFTLAAELTEEEILDSPFWRILSMPMFFVGSFNILSAKNKFCPRLCTLEKYQNCPNCALSDVWLGKETECKLDHKVRFPGLMKVFKARAKEIWLKIFVLTFLLTLAVTLFTPGIFY